MCLFHADICGRDFQLVLKTCAFVVLIFVVVVWSLWSTRVRFGAHCCGRDMELVVETCAQFCGRDLEFVVESVLGPPYHCWITPLKYKPVHLTFLCSFFQV